MKFSFLIVTLAFFVVVGSLSFDSVALYVKRKYPVIAGIVLMLLGAGLNIGTVLLVIYLTFYFLVWK
jgi:hypothetical protein